MYYLIESEKMKAKNYRHHIAELIVAKMLVAHYADRKKHAALNGPLSGPRRHASHKICFSFSHACGIRTLEAKQHAALHRKVWRAKAELGAFMRGW
jgi:hypothetical protein